MTNDQAYNSVLVGLPASGKTTFIAALWHVLRNRDVAGALSLAFLEGDDTHLDNIRDAWLSCKEQERTLPGAEHYLRLNLAGESGEKVCLGIPDLSGEGFRDAIRDRQWSEEVDYCVQESEGVLFFLHPEGIRPPVRIGQVREVVHGETISAGADWRPELAASQAQLVDLLQLVLHRQKIREGRRVAIIVSAWDVLGDEERTPRQWLSDALPLFTQFLSANESNLFELEIYGVSAIGGDLEKDREALLEKRPSERLIVVGRGERAHDITAPIGWLLAGSRTTNS